MLSATSAFSPTGNGLYTGESFGGYTGGGYSGTRTSLGGNGTTLTGSRATNKIANYIRTEYQDTIEKAKKYLLEGKYDKAIGKIESLRQHAQEIAAEYNIDVDDEQISTALDKAGADFDAYIDDTSRGAFSAGLFNGIPIAGLFFDSYSKEEIEAKLEGEKVSRVDALKEGAGKVISGGASGAAVGAVVGGGPVGAAVGALIGITLAFGQNIIKDGLCAQ